MDEMRNNGKHKFDFRKKWKIHNFKNHKFRNKCFSFLTPATRADFIGKPKQDWMICWGMMRHNVFYMRVWPSYPCTSSIVVDKQHQAAVVLSGWMSDRLMGYEEKGGILVFWLGKLFFKQTRPTFCGLYNKESDIFGVMNVTKQLRAHIVPFSLPNPIYPCPTWRPAMFEFHSFMLCRSVVSVFETTVIQRYLVEIESFNLK